MPRHIKLIEKQLCKRAVYTGGAVNFNADTVRLLNGKTAVREYIDHPGAVAVLPVLADGRIVMVRQYRYPVKQATLEIPAGKMHGKGDSPLKRGRAELREETGYAAKRFFKLITFWPCCAFSNEVLHIYAARGLRAGRPDPDEDEFLRLEFVTLPAALAMVKSGRIKDSKTVIAVMAYALGLAAGN